MDEKCTKLCTQSYCCTTIEQKIETIDYDYMLWQIAHDNIELLAIGKPLQWYLLVHTKCSQLNEHNLCEIYEDRPMVCKEYSNVGCEYDISLDERLRSSSSAKHFKTYDEFKQYLTEQKLS